MELWHVLNRGVEKRKIFMDDRDRYRFVHGLLLFNTKSPANNTTYLLEERINDIVSRYTPDRRIVDVHAWCLMPNHYHILLSGRIENGISRFLRKLNIGYAKYFNGRHKRSGTLFQGRTKKILIDSDAHYLHILNYIHFNALDLSGHNQWRAGSVDNPHKALEDLRRYPWSSYNDYCGRKRFSQLLTQSQFADPHMEKSTKEYLHSLDLKHEYMLEN